MNAKSAAINSQKRAKATTTRAQYDAILSAVHAASNASKPGVPVYSVEVPIPVDADGVGALLKANEYTFKPSKDKWVIGWEPPKA